MTNKIELTQEIVRELLDYDPETGLLFWKRRKEHWFKNGRYSKKRNAAIWNAKYAGTEASTLNTMGYKSISIFKKRYYAHRIAWIYTHGNFPTLFLDHINGNPKDNRLINLREVDNQRNHTNMKRDFRNKSGVTGITWNKEKHKWEANIYSNGKNTFLGYSDSIEELKVKRKEAEVLLGFHSNHGRSTID